MNISPPWFLQRLFETVKPVQEPDPADMGTAYGMECSLAAQEPKPLVQAPTPPVKPNDRR
jgi:hypothetical protein